MRDLAAVGKFSSALHSTVTLWNCAVFCATAKSPLDVWPFQCKMSSILATSVHGTLQLTGCKLTNGHGWCYCHSSVTDLLALQSAVKSKAGPSPGSQFLWRQDSSGVSLIVGPFCSGVNLRCSYGVDYEAVAELARESFHSLVK